MNPPPLIAADQCRNDDEHIKLLSVFHFVVGGLALFGIAFLFMHYFILSTVFSRPELWKQQGGAGPPAEFFSVFVYFYIFMGVVFLIACGANILSGMFLRQRKHRMFSFVVAGLNFLQMPFGTVLGVFTIIVLLRDSVRLSYAARESHEAGLGGGS